MRQIRHHFSEVKQTFFQFADRIIRDRSVIRHADVYFEWSQIYAISAVAEVQSSLYLNEYDIAKTDLMKNQKQFSRLQDQFFNNPDPLDPAFIRIPTKDIPGIRQQKDQLVETKNRLESFFDEIQLLERSNISYELWIDLDKEFEGTPKRIAFISASHNDDNVEKR